MQNNNLIHFIIKHYNIYCKIKYFIEIQFKNFNNLKKDKIIDILYLDILLDKLICPENEVEKINLHKILENKKLTDINFNFK